MSVGESLGSHSLHSFAEFLQQHINSPEASSCLTSKRKPLKPLNVLKPFSLKFMAAEKSVRKGGRQQRGGTSTYLPNDLAELYKTDPEEDYNQRKTQIQWIRRYWAEQWFKYKFVTQEYAEKNAIKSPWGDILYPTMRLRSARLLVVLASTPGWLQRRRSYQLSNLHLQGKMNLALSSQAA